MSPERWWLSLASGWAGPCWVAQGALPCVRRCPGVPFVLVYIGGIQVRMATMPCREGSLPTGSPLYDAACLGEVQRPRRVHMHDAAELSGWLGDPGAGGNRRLTAEVEGPLGEFGEHSYLGALAQPPPPRVF